MDDGNTPKIRPRNDNVLLELDPETEETSPGGIVIPSTRKRQPQEAVRATVLASGPGYLHRVRRPKHGQAPGHEELSVWVANRTRPGDRVIVLKLAGQDYGMDHHAPRQNAQGAQTERAGRQLRIVREDEVIGWLDEEAPATLAAE